VIGFTDARFPSCIFSLRENVLDNARDDIARATSGRGMLIPPHQNKLASGDMD
jgi:hypothetical protein